MSTEEVSAINIGYQKAESSLRKDEERAREVATILRDREKRHLSEALSFGVIKEKLFNASKERGALASRLQVTEELANKLRTQGVKVRESLTAVQETKAKQILPILLFFFVYSWRSIAFSVWLLYRR